VFGVAAEGVKADGDKYTVSRAWLAHELNVLAMKGKAPKLASAKEGVALRGVRPKSLGATLGLKNGDVITAVADKPVKSAEDIIKALRQVDGDNVSVKVMRRKKEAVLSYTLSN
jgi:S1-C subfamily serine protease